MASGALRRPQLRGLLTRQIFRNLGITFGLIVTTITTMRFFVVQRRKNAYAEYYSNLDSEAMFNEMKKAGVFQSVPLDDGKKAEEQQSTSIVDESKEEDKKGKKA